MGSPNGDRVQTSCRLDVELRDRLDDFCRTTPVSRDKVIDRALREFFDKRGGMAPGTPWDWAGLD